MVLNELRTNKYDYVMWMDSDSVIMNMDIDLGKLLNSYSSDIFIGCNDTGHITNAGIFIIKNTKIGRQYMIDCIRRRNKSCINKNNKLNGIWTLTCYEQGIMNILINEKYHKYTTVLPRKIIYTDHKCKNNVFIMHMCGSSPKDRIKCFTSKDNK